MCMHICEHICVHIICMTHLAPCPFYWLCNVYKHVRNVYKRDRKSLPTWAIAPMKVYWMYQVSAMLLYHVRFGHLLHLLQSSSRVRGTINIKCVPAVKRLTTMPWRCVAGGHLLASIAVTLALSPGPLTTDNVRTTSTCMLIFPAFFWTWRSVLFIFLLNQTDMSMCVLCLN
jgi:hypothetical protein